MATLEEILGLALGAGSAQVAKDDPYIGLAGTGNDIGQLFIKEGASGKYGKNSTRDAILGAAISGLFGGAMGSLSSDYQSDRLLKYNDLLGRARAGEDVTGDSSVTSALAKTAQNQANQSKLIQEAVAADETRKLRNQVALKASENLLSNPQTSASLLKQILGVDVPESKPIAVEAGDRGVEGSMLDEINREAQILMQSGMPATQAATTARDAFKARKKELEDSYARINEAEKSGQSLLRMVDNLESASTRAGDTGMLGGLRNMGANLLGEIGMSGQAQKAAAGQELESLGAEIVRNARQVGSGPMSDRDVQMYLQSGPSLSNSEAANQAIIERMRTAGTLQSKYAEFMREQRNAGVPVNEAEQAWSSLVQQNPYFNRDLETGALVPNPAWSQGLSASPTTATAPTNGSIVGPDGNEYIFID
jgi:hypothetical protein